LSELVGCSGAEPRVSAREDRRHVGLRRQHARHRFADALVGSRHHSHPRVAARGRLAARKPAHHQRQTARIAVPKPHKNAEHGGARRVTCAWSVKPDAGASRHSHASTGRPAACIARTV